MSFSFIQGLYWGLQPDNSISSRELWGEAPKRQWYKPEYVWFSEEYTQSSTHLRRWLLLVTRNSYLRQWFPCFSRYGLIMLFRRSNYRRAWFTPSTEHLRLVFVLNPFQGALLASYCSGSRLNAGRAQAWATVFVLRHYLWINARGKEEEARAAAEEKSWTATRPWPSFGQAPGPREQIHLWPWSCVALEEWGFLALPQALFAWVSARERQALAQKDVLWPKQLPPDRSPPSTLGCKTFLEGAPGRTAVSAPQSTSAIHPCSGTTSAASRSWILLPEEIQHKARRTNHSPTGCMWPQTRPPSATISAGRLASLIPEE